MRPHAWLGLLAAAAVSVPIAANAQSAAPPEVRFIADAPGVTLYRYDGPFGADQPLCRAPCGLTLDSGKGARFYFGGDEIVESPRFSLEGRTGEVRIRVQAGRDKSSRYAAIAALPVGGAALAGGLFTLLIGGIWDRGRDVESPHASTGVNRMVLGGGITAGLGALLIVGGIVGVAHTPRTQYEFARLQPSPGGVAIAF